MPLHPELPPRRELGSRRAGGGRGGGTPTRNPRRHGQSLSDQLANAVALRRLDVGVDPDLVFKMRATGGLDLDMLARRGVTALGETADWTYFVLSRDEGAALAASVRDYAAGPDADGGKGQDRSLFDKLDGIEPYGPADRRGPGLEDISVGVQRTVLDVSVWPSSDAEEAQRRTETVRNVVADTAGEVLREDVRPQLTVLRVAVNSAGLDDLLATSVVEGVRTPPVPFLDPSDWRNVTAQELSVQATAGVAVGILDDAPATGHPLLAGLIASVSYLEPAGHTPSAAGHHGSLVAGRVLFPSLHADLRDHAPVRAVGQVHVARILEPDPADPTATRFLGGDAGELPHVLVERAIRLLHAQHGVRIFNLSLGYREPFNGTHVGELTELLDDLARELDVVMVVPTGNAPPDGSGRMAGGQHALADYPGYLVDAQHRLAEPGPAALALTVGAIAHSDAPMVRTPPQLGNSAVAGIGHLSPFSRTGPGVGAHAQRCNKPDLVHQGGNWVLLDTGQLMLEDPGVAVISTALSDSGALFRACCGTSFAVPAVSRCAADVLGSYPRASANLVRALVAGSATEPAGARAVTDMVKRRRLYGAGMPDSRRATNSDASRVTMTFDGDMAVDTAVIHPLPVPAEFVAGRSASRRLRVSLAFDPPVRRQRRDYLAASMQVDLYRAVDIAELARVVAAQVADDSSPPIEDRRHVTRLEPGVDSSRNATLQVRVWEPQRLNIDDGDTYYLVVRHTVATWARGWWERQRYALAVTLEDEGRLGLDLYAAVTQQVTVRSRARVRV